MVNIKRKRLIYHLYTTHANALIVSSCNKEWAALYCKYSLFFLVLIYQGVLVRMNIFFLEFTLLYSSLVFQLQRWFGRTDYKCLDNVFGVGFWSIFCFVVADILNIHPEH